MNPGSRLSQTSPGPQEVPELYGKEDGGTESDPREGLRRLLGEEGGLGISHDQLAPQELSQPPFPNSESPPA